MAALAAMVCCIPISEADTWRSEGLVYEVLEDGTAAVTGYTGDSVAISVPEYVTIDGITYSVTSIGDYAFEGCSSLVTIELPDSITSIGSHAFGDTSIIEFRVPSGVTDMTSVLYDCGSLESITVSEGSTAFAAVDGVLYSKDLSTLIRVPQALEGEMRIPDGVVACDVDALNWCSRITSLVIPDSMETMNFGSLCTQLRYVYIGASVGPFETSHLATSRSLETIEVSSENDVYVSVDGVLVRQFGVRDPGHGHGRGRTGGQQLYDDRDPDRAGLRHLDGALGGLPAQHAHLGDGGHGPGRSVVLA